MTNIKAIDAFMSSRFPGELSEAWDNDGIMLCKSCDKEVKRALVCLEVTAEAVDAALSFGADVIITHHPLIFNPIKSLVNWKYDLFEKLIKGEISVLSYHTRLDKAPGGVNDVLAEALGLSGISDAGEFLRVGSLECEMSGDDFAKHLKEKLGISSIRAYVNSEKRIKKVAVCGGAGKDFLIQASECADAYVSSDFSHNTYLCAKELGISVFDCGHYTTENPVTTHILRLLEAEFTQVEFKIFDVKAPFETL